MSFFDEHIRVVNIDDENSVTIRCLTRAEVHAIREQCQKRGKRGELILDEVKAVYLMTERGIKAWNGSGFDGREPTQENIAQLPNHIAQRIFDEISDFGEMDDDEKKPYD